MKLQNLRHARHIKWPIYIFFGIVIVSFIFFYGWNQMDRNGGNGFNQNYAKLRSDSLHPLRRWVYLDKGALSNSKIEAIEEKYRAMPPLPPQLQQMLRQQNVFEKMVKTEDMARVAANDVLLQRAADRLNMHLSTEEFANMLKRTPGITDDMLEREARAQGYADKFGYFEALRRMEEQQRIKAIKSLVAHASVFELWQEYRLANDKLVLRMAAYPVQEFEKKVAVTPADLEKYLKEHKEEFHVPPMRRYAYVAAKRDAIMAKIKPTDKQLEAFWQQNQTQYMDKAATRVKEIFSPLGEGQLTTAPLAFNAVLERAKKENDWTTLSQDLTKQYPGTDFIDRGDRWIEDTSTEVSARFFTAIKGDDQGTTGVKTQDKATTGVKAMDQQTTGVMAKDELTTGVKTADQKTTMIFDDNGYHLVRVLERRNEGVPPLAKIRDRVLADYKEKEAEKLFQAEIERFNAERKNLAEDKATTVSVHALAQRLKLDDKLTTRVAADSAEIPEVGSFERDRGYLAGLALNEVSDPLTTPDTVAAFQVVEQKDGYDPPLAEVREKVEQAYRKTRASEQARQAAEQGLKLVQSGAPFDQALADAPRKPFDTGEFARPDTVTGLDAPLIDFRKQTMKINEGATGLSPYGADEKKPLGFAVWKVQKLNEPKQEDFARERQRFEQDYMQLAQETIVREWLADERAKAQYQFLAEKQ